MTSEAGNDYLSPVVLQRWLSGAYEGSPYFSELESGRGFWGAAGDALWGRLGRVVRSVLVAVSENEIMRDDILALARVFEGVAEDEAGLKVDVLMGEDEGHEGPIRDFATGRPPSKLSNEIAAWVRERV